MSDPEGEKTEGEADAGPATTGHRWDGITELDNPLPRWWLYTFYACIVVAAVYWILMPAWPGVRGYTPGVAGQSDRADVRRDLADLERVRGAEGAMLRQASLEQIEHDPKLQSYALAVGQSVFGDNCATCHGAGGVGSKGYPNLRDDVWLWGGSLSEIEHTIKVGIRSGHAHARESQMPAFGRDEMLQPGQIDDLTEYVVHLSRRPAAAAAVTRAAPLFAEQCVACHMYTGGGDRAQGAPDLTDAEWLYGADRGAIRDQIVNGRGGSMPTWESRFSPETIKAVTVYIHANAGGQ